MKPDLKQAVVQAAPTTKAAQLREVMPEIEMKLATGTPLAAIHQALTHAGLDLTFKTLKTYLHRYRKKQRWKSVNQPPPPVGPAGTPLPSASASLETDTPRGQISMQALDLLMKPDPADQAEKLARYERLAKQQRRSAR